MHISPTIHYNAGHSYKTNTHYNTHVHELMNLLHGNKFSLLTLSVLMSSVLTNYVSVHVCISVQALVETHAVEQMKLNRFCSWEV